MVLITRNFSNILLTLFTVALLVSATVSEFFQAPIISSRQLSKYQFLFSSENIDKVTNVRLKTEIGEFVVNKSDNHWILKEPRVIDANNDIITNMLESLKEIKIKRIFPKDQINLINFSLNKPLVELSLSPIKDKAKELSFGLVNPIDKSTYVTFKNENVIYHVTLYDFNFEKVNITNLIDSRIFNFNSNEIVKFNVKDRNNRDKINFELKNDQWQSKKNVLDEQKVLKYLTDLLSINSNIILDKRDEEINKDIERYMKRPLYEISTTLKNGDNITYKISSLVRSIKDVKMEERQNFLIIASNRQHPFLVSKSNYKFFYRSSKNFKSRNFKKFIY